MGHRYLVYPMHIRNFVRRYMRRCPIQEQLEILYYAWFGCSEEIVRLTFAYRPGRMSNPDAQ
jgi:hypothetical protein